ncbi:zinc ribbon domain-containing protein [Candidatus Poribacteria bacterium]|jgi:putative FmdB family regulatory protein|nr:zinc ribbon domain-containing protein [Candidatus Poribacteria bacterium]MBT5531562.1 zinc ribbon domain-containing protein [Candidatus Poribacteria bacterium]MBT5714974.1 zinc ribbon domain-containing protein [Candidatus Poribacteria bacterium]MBT7100382.1 zinc ribbon domain-containing protein [Candidatus Poribacteria bacterium]MBT7808315.1 zinc ribbon domain-containing protein [Candidatus Poribacteria bacterium]
MPTYEYKCNHCGVGFERFQSIKAQPVKDCPECEEKGTVSRLISGGAGLIFRGDGFYITDHRSDSYKAGAKADSKPSGDSKSDSSSKSDTPSSSKSDSASSTSSSAGSD